MASQSSNKTFSFNLVPPKSKEEIVLIEERDNSIFYSIILIFFAVFIFFILSIAQSIFIKPRISKLEDDLDQQDEQIETFNPIRLTNGELFVKAQALGPILETDFEAINFLAKTNEIVKSDPNSKIVSYGREGDGRFALTVVTSDYAAAARMLEEGKTVEGIENLYLRQVSLDGTTARATIAFNITNL